MISVVIDRKNFRELDSLPEFVLDWESASEEWLHLFINSTNYDYKWLETEDSVMWWAKPVQFLSLLK